MTSILEAGEKINITHSCTDASEKRFAEIIGSIEELLLDEEFIKLQTDFFDKYWKHFDTDEENKLIYMDIFQLYTKNIEQYIEQHLINSVEDFKMQEFEFELNKRKNELEGELFEMLSTFSDFLAFKNMFLDYKEMKEGKGVDFSDAFTVSKYNLQE